MRKPNIAHLHIATTNARWTEVNGRVSDAITNLCGDHDKAEALMLIVDLMTNEHYDPSDRESVIAEVLHQAFKYTRGYDDLLRDAIENISPAPQKLARVS